MTIELDTQPRGQLHGIGRGQRAGFGDFAPLADERENLIRAPHQHRVHDRPRLLRLSGDGLQHGLIRWITEEVWPANEIGRASCRERGEATAQTRSRNDTAEEYTAEIQTTITTAS